MDNCRNILGVSDPEHAVQLDTNIRATINKKPRRRVFVYKKADWGSIAEDIKNFEQDFFENSPEEKTVNENWEAFKNNINSTLENNIPTKLTKDFRDLPWMNRRIKRLIRRRQRFYNRAKKTKKDKHWKDFRLTRKMIQVEMKKQYWGYIDTIINPENDNSQKGMWKFIKSTRRSTVGVSTLKTPGNVAKDAPAKADMLNEQFCSVFTDEKDGDVPPSGNRTTLTSQTLAYPQQGYLSYSRSWILAKHQGPTRYLLGS